MCFLQKTDVPRDLPIGQAPVGSLIVQSSLLVHSDAAKRQSCAVSVGKMHQDAQVTRNVRFADTTFALLPDVFAAVIASGFCLSFCSWFEWQNRSHGFNGKSLPTEVAPLLGSCSEDLLSIQKAAAWLPVNHSESPDAE